MAFHKIFTKEGYLTAIYPHVPDSGNHGLPDWFFDGDGLYIEFLVDKDEDTVSWVPGCGPAPCWDRTLSEFEDDTDMFAQFKTWIEATY